MKVQVLLTHVLARSASADADGVVTERQVNLRFVLNFVSGLIKQGRKIVIVTDGGRIEVGHDTELWTAVIEQREESNRVP